MCSRQAVISWRWQAVQGRMSASSQVCLTQRSLAVRGRACSLIPFLYSSGSEPFSSFTWQPTDFDPEMLPFITAEVKARGLRNVKEPVMLVRETHVLPALCSSSSSTWRLNHVPLSCRCSPTDRMCGPILARGHVLDRRPSTASSPSTSSTSRRTSAPVDS